MSDDDEVLDLTQDDYDNNEVDMPEAVFKGANFNSSVREPDDEYMRNVMTTTSASRKSKGKGKGKGKRISVGSLEAEAKSKAKADKQVAMQKQAEEKAARKAAGEMNKIYKPGECMKYMNIEVHPVLAGAWYMADVSREAAAVGARVVTAANLCDPALLMWTRNVQPRFAASDGQVGLTSSKEPCGRALYVTLAEEVQEHVSARTLSQRVAQVRDMAAAELTVVVFGVKEFFKSSGRKTANSNRKVMTEIELEMAITDLLVTAGCDTVLVNSASELALLIVQFTKAIAEAPHKKAKRVFEEQAEFYMKGDNKNCIGVDKDGNGLARLWQQMMAVLPHSSLETSRAVCSQYKSPLMMYEALQERDSIMTLAEVGVTRAGVPGARARRLGPEFARKLHALFTVERGDVLVD